MLGNYGDGNGNVTIFRSSHSIADAPLDDYSACSLLNNAYHNNNTPDGGHKLHSLAFAEQALLSRQRP
jgi:hypothetical protein